MEQLVVGIIRGSHGLSGNCKVESTSGEYGHFAGMREVTLRKDGSERPCRIERVSAGDRVLYVKFAEIDSPEEARRFSGWEILAPREYACPCGEGEYYVEDLKQCSLVYAGGNAGGLAAEAAPIVVGSITDVLEGGAGDLLEVVLSESCGLLAENARKTASGGKRTVMVPFKKEFIGDVDIPGKKVQLMHLWVLD